MLLRILLQGLLPLLLVLLVLLVVLLMLLDGAACAHLVSRCYQPPCMDGQSLHRE
jgi:hypothetical protein